MRFWVGGLKPTIPKFEELFYADRNEYWKIKSVSEVIIVIQFNFFQILKTLTLSMIFFYNPNKYYDFCKL